MESIIPPVLNCVQHIRWQIGSGAGMRDAIRSYLDAHADSFADQLRDHWFLHTQATHRGRQIRPFATEYQKILWELICRGAQGEPIEAALFGLEQEITHAAQFELDEHVSALPLKVLVPLLLLQFPAYLVLLLGPLLRDLQRQMMAIVFLCIALNFCASSNAQTLSQTFAHKLSHARSENEIRSLSREYQELRLAREACRLQIETQEAPLSCYESLTREKKWQLITRIDAEKLQQRLDQRCSFAASNLYIPNSESPGDQFLSLSCRRDVRRAQKHRRYRQGATVGMNFEK